MKKTNEDKLLEVAEILRKRNKPIPEITEKETVEALIDALLPAISWIRPSNAFYSYECSECGAVATKQFYFCPECGGRWKGETDNE